MHFQLEPGDKLMLMSDGIIEATNAEGRLSALSACKEVLSKT